MGSLKIQTIYQPREFYSIASYLFSAEKYDELIRICRNTRELNPKIADFCYQLEIHSLLEQNQLDKASEILTEAEKKYPENSRIDECYGRFYIKKGSPDLAKEYYLKAIKKARGSAHTTDYKYQIAAIYGRERKYRESLEYILSALSDDPENESAFNLLINISHHYTIHNVFESQLFLYIVIQLSKYKTIYPAHPISNLEYFHFQNVLTNYWNNEILTNEDKIELLLMRNLEGWIDIFEHDMSCVYESARNYKRDDLKIKIAENYLEDDNEYEVPFDEMFSFEESEDFDENDEFEEGMEGEEFDEEEIKEEEIDKLINFEDFDYHSNTEFILALVYLGGMSMTQANMYYNIPTKAEPEEIKKLNWANEIMDMIYELRYKYQTIMDPGAKESIDKIKSAASKHMDRKLADGVIDQLLRLIESIVNKGKAAAASNNIWDNIGLN